MFIKNELDKMRLPKIYLKNKKEYYLDEIRKKLICVTPEEGVRQRMVKYLVEKMGIPKEMILIEENLSHYGIKTSKRADIVIHEYNKEGILLPIAIVECKSEFVNIDYCVHNQAMEYADMLGCDYIFITNGIDLFTYKYDEDKQIYIELKKTPSYSHMLKGEGVKLLTGNVPKRIRFCELEEKSDLYLDDFGYSTTKDMIPFLINLWECLLDLSHKLPKRKYKLFELIEDYGNRVLSYGNAGGGLFTGVYRSFLIKVGGNTEFVSIGFSKYSTDAKQELERTSLNVAVDDDKVSHHSLQLIIDDNVLKEGNNYKFTHSGRIGIGNIGSGKISELKSFIDKSYVKILNDGIIELGELRNNELLYLDDPQVVEFIENLISYALIRDEYREYVKSK